MMLSISIPFASSPVNTRRRRLVFTGEEANGMLMDSIISEIERLCGR